MLVSGGFFAFSVDVVLSSVLEETAALKLPLLVEQQHQQQQNKHVVSIVQCTVADKPDKHRPVALRLRN